MSNFSFLLKITAMQIFFVGLSQFPVACLVSLMILEVFYVGYVLVSEVLNCHLKNPIAMIPKVLQSLLNLAIEFLLLNSYIRLSDPKFALPHGV